MFKALWTKYKNLPAIWKAGSAFILLMIVSAIFAWYSPDTKGDPKKFTQATAIPGTATIPKVEVPVAGGKIRVIPKDKVGKKIVLPPEILLDPKKELVATGVAPASETDTDIIVTTDTSTGDTTVSLKPQAASLMAFENKLRLGVGYGIGTEGNTAKIFAEWGFVRVGSIHGAVQGEINATATRQPEAKIMGVAYYAPTK